MISEKDFEKINRYELMSDFLEFPKLKRYEEYVKKMYDEYLKLEVINESKN